MPAQTETLTRIRQKQTNSQMKTSIETDADPPDHRRKISMVDGMILVQKMTTKPATVVTVKDLSVCFNDRLMNLTRSFDEVILVFDTYKAEEHNQAKEAKRKGSSPVPSPR